MNTRNAGQIMRIGVTILVIAIEVTVITATFPMVLQGAGEEYVEVASMPIARLGFDAFSHGDYIYVFGGSTGADTAIPAYAVDRYSPLADEWEVYDTLDFVCWSGQYCMIGDDVYVAGGIEVDVWNTDRVYRYNVVSKQSDTLTGYGGIIHSGAAFDDMGRYRLLGGHAYNPILDVNLLFDPSTDTWTAENRLPGVLEKHAIAVNGDEAHILGGRGLGGDASNIHLTYSTSTDSFGYLPNLPLGVKNASAVLNGGEIWLFGGKTSNSVHVDNVQVYNTTTGSWRNGSPLPFVWVVDAVTHQGAMYVMGGIDHNSVRSDKVFRLVNLSCILRGDINHDGSRPIDIADLVYLVDYMFNGGPEPSSFDEGDVNGSGIEPIDISDLVYLVDFMFLGGPAPPPCP